LYDHLPKLEGVEHYERMTGDDVTLILPPSPPKWMKEFLNLVGYDPAECLEWDGRWSRVDRLIVPSLRRYRDIPYPSGVSSLRDRVLEHVSLDAADEDYANHIYVSRSDADRRQVMNEPEAIEMLRQYEFEPYVLTDFSVTEQIRIFSQADIIVGGHGSNLADIVAGSDLTLLEICRENINSACYYSISTTLGFNYCSLPGKSVEGDIVVDLRELEEIIKKIV
jgi:capsular polysaccharide biosynthesis protein